MSSCKTLFLQYRRVGRVAHESPLPVRPGPKKAFPEASFWESKLGWLKVPKIADFAETAMKWATMFEPALPHVNVALMLMVIAQKIVPVEAPGMCTHAGIFFTKLFLLILLDTIRYHFSFSCQPFILRH
jgi:hypothetical protein